MQVSDEVIKVLEYLCEKIGVTIDWTSNNVLPCIQQLCEKYIRYEIATSVVWIVLAIIVAVIAVVFSKVVDLEGEEKYIPWYAIVVVILVVGMQVFDIVECCTFPEKVVYEYIQTVLNRG